MFGQRPRVNRVRARVRKKPEKIGRRLHESHDERLVVGCLDAEHGHGNLTRYNAGRILEIDEHLRIKRRRRRVHEPPHACDKMVRR